VAGVAQLWAARAALRTQGPSSEHQIPYKAISAELVQKVGALKILSSLSEG